MSKNAGTEEHAGSLHSKVLDILHECTEPITITKEDGEVQTFYDKDYIKMALVFLDKNKITVAETLTNAAGSLRNKLAQKGVPKFGNKVQPLYATEEEVDAKA